MSFDNATPSPGCCDRTSARGYRRRPEGVRQRPRRVGRLPLESLDERMRRTRTGLHFVDPQVEREFRAWHLVDARRYTRVGLITGTLGWLAAYAAIGAGVPGTWASTAPYVFGVVLPITLFPLALTFGPSRWMLWGAWCANAGAGLVATVLIGFHVLR